MCIRDRVTAVVAAVAGVIYFFKNNRSSDEDIFEDDFEDEDFDLDEDLKPAGDRGYVSLTPKAEEKEEATEPVEATTEKEEVSEEKDEASEEKSEV